MKIKYLVPFMLLASVAQAQSVKAKLVQLGMRAELAAYIASIIPGGSVVSNNAFLKGRNAANSADISMLKVDASDDTVINADSGDVVKVSVANTPAAQFDADSFDPITDDAFDLGTAAKNIRNIYQSGDSIYDSGKGPKFAVAVFTPQTAYPTPGAGDLAARVNVIATAAPTAAFIPMPAATANVGETFEIYNQSAHPVAIVAQSGDTINAIAAGTPYACATTKLCECKGVANGQYACVAK